MCTYTCTHTVTHTHTYTVYLCVRFRDRTHWSRSLQQSTRHLRKSPAWTLFQTLSRASSLSHVGTSPRNSPGSLNARPLSETLITLPVTTWFFFTTSFLPDVWRTKEIQCFVCNYRSCLSWGKKRIHDSTVWPIRRENKINVWPVRTYMQTHTQTHVHRCACTHSPIKEKEKSQVNCLVYQKIKNKI